MKDLWRHALATGRFGKEIARRIRHNVENALLCGLAHNIGKPVVIYKALAMRKANEAKKPPWAVIEALLHEAHIAVEGRLEEAWRLTTAVQEAMLLDQDHIYHLATSPNKGAIITCLAVPVATYLLDPSSIEEDELRALPVVHDLNFYPEDMVATLVQNNF